MLTRINNLLLLSALLLVCGCVSDKTMNTTNAVCQILVRDSTPIEQFIRPHSGDFLDAGMCRVGQETYVIFFNNSHDVAVAYDLGLFNNSRIDISNYGFGTLQSNGEWSLFHTNTAGGFFESQGGLGTLREIDEAMQKCVKEKPSVRFNWPATNAVNL
jgi:hypothetical protein